MQVRKTSKGVMLYFADDEIDYGTAFTDTDAAYIRLHAMTPEFAADLERATVPKPPPTRPGWT